MQPSLVQRLRDSVTQCRAIDRSQLLTEAADEIERLRLTDAEREAVERVIAALHGWKLRPRDAADAATLRGLLERLK